MIYFLIFLLLLISPLIYKYIFLTYKITPKRDWWAGIAGILVGVLLLAGFILYLII